ncbi:MAG: ROK family protein [Paracoccaceae bacterium]
MSARLKSTIGLDVGGTRIRAARVTQDGEMLHHLVEPVVSDRTGFVNQVLRLINTVRDETTCGVGIGIPGRVMGGTGQIVTAGYLDIDGLELPDLVRTKTQLPCQTLNDAAMALIAEGRGSSGLVAMITVGTGVGGALLLDGIPYHGGDFAGQFGHIVVAADGPMCNCGRRGCVETFSAGPALGALIAKADFPQSTTAAGIIEAAANGDDKANDVMEAWAAPMERALQTLIAVVDPTRIIFGGGLGIDMARIITARNKRSAWFNRPIVPARWGDNAGVIGAGLAGFL